MRERIRSARDLVAEIKGREQCVACSRPIRAGQSSIVFHGKKFHRKCLYRSRH